jgi:hypothetical protein
MTEITKLLGIVCLGGGVPVLLIGIFTKNWVVGFVGSLFLLNAGIQLDIKEDKPVATYSIKTDETYYERI